MKDKKITLSPFSYMDFEQLESWLTANASEGWICDEYRYFIARFHKEAPSKRIYRVIPRTSMHVSPEEKDVFAASGWMFLGAARGVAIYYNDDPDAEEIFDPDSFKIYSRRYARNLILLAVIWLVYPYILTKSLSEGIHEGLLNNINDSGLATISAACFAAVIFTFVFLWWIYVVICQFIRIKRGRPIDHNKPYKARGIVNRTIIITGFLTFVIIVGSATTPSPYERGHLSMDEALAYSDAQPYLLRDLSPEEWNYANVGSDKFNGGHDTDANIVTRGEYFIRENSNILFSKSISERYEYCIEDAMKDDGKELYYVQYNSSYYEARSERIAKRFIDEMPGYHQIRDANDRIVSMKEIEIPCCSVDYAGYHRGEDNYQELIMLKGKRIIYISYIGKQNLKAAADTIADSLQ